MSDSKPNIDGDMQPSSSRDERSEHSSPEGNRRISDDDLEGELRRLATELGRAPTSREMNADGAYAAATYRRRFGSWTAAVERVGLEAQSHGGDVQISTQDVREAIQEVADQLGHTPTAAEMDRHGRYSRKTAAARFGSWNAALRAAGFDLNHEREISDERLLAEIRRLADELGHPPSTNDLKQHGRVSHRVYYRRFDGWHSAVRAAGYEPRGWPSGPENPQWVGGDTYYYYGSNWETQRLRALRRDGFRCQMPDCEMTRATHYEQYGKDLNVHHIVPVETYLRSANPDFEAMNDLDNLVTLCVSHHSYWERFSPLRPDIQE